MNLDQIIRQYEPEHNPLKPSDKAYYLGNVLADAYVANTRMKMSNEEAMIKAREYAAEIAKEVYR